MGEILVMKKRFLHESIALANIHFRYQWNQFTPTFVDIHREELLFPLWRFNHAAGFTKITKELVYQTVGKIEDARPPLGLRLLGLRSEKWNVPERIIGQLNAAKGRLRSI